MSPVRFWQKLMGFFSRRRASAPAGPVPPSESRVGPGLEEALQSAVERLIEDEALTADLVDAAARPLLDWGIAQVTAIVRETGAVSDEVRARLGALRQQMRDIARQVGQLPPEEQSVALQRMLETFGPPPEGSGQETAPGTQDGAEEAS